MKTILFVLLFFSCFSSYGKRTPEKYFLLNDGSKQNFMQLDHLKGDTVFFMNNSQKSFLLVDSISAIHVYSPSRALGAGIFGFFCGALLGAGVGLALPGEGDYAGLGHGIIGFLVGGVVGATLGSLHGAQDAKAIDMDLKPYIKQQKIDMLSTVLKDLN